jgi:Fuc2NAc and GlcNAc transferase
MVEAPGYRPQAGAGEMDRLISFIGTNKYQILYFANGAIGFLGAYWVLKSFVRSRLIDNPNERSSHSEPIPRGAGIGILLAFMLSGMVLRLPTTMIYAVIIVGFISFYEDHFTTPVKFRLNIQFAAAILFLFPYMAAQGNKGWTWFIAIGMTLTFIVGTANMFNFMDGINGIAGITSMIGFGLLWLNANIIGGKLSPENSPLGTLAVCIAISCIGFLPLNLLRARVFLGDVGSITLGFLFAGLVVYLSRSLLDIICLSGFMIPFYMDETVSVIRRIRRRQSLLLPHRGHLYQFLANEMKIAHWKISLGYGLAQLVLGLIIIKLKSGGYAPLIAIWAGSFFAMAILYRIVTRKIFPEKTN